MKLSFHATDTTANADDEVSDCSFTGDDGKAIGVMTEAACFVRLSWHDGTEGEDEAVVELQKVVLTEGRCTLSLRREGEGTFTEIPYDTIEVTWDEADERSRALEGVFARLLADDPSRLVIA